MLDCWSRRKLLGFGSKGCGFKVLGFRGFGFRVEALRVLDLGFRAV